jgi:hypothetical protein
MADQPSIFVSYSHADTRWLNELDPHLKGLSLHARVERFDDRQLFGGDDWNAEVKAALDRGPAGSGCLGERGLHLLLVGQQFPHARPPLHPLQMRHAVLELGEIEVELSASPKAPEEMGIDGGEMLEEPFTIGELVVCALVVLEQLLRGEQVLGA